MKAYGIDGYGGDKDPHIAHTGIHVWSTLEADVSIICGKHMTAFCPHPRNRDSVI